MVYITLSCVDNNINEYENKCINYEGIKKPENKYI